MDAVVGKALNDAAASTSTSLLPTVTAAAEEEEGQEEAPSPRRSSMKEAAGGSTFGYMGGKWCWEWLVVGCASGNVGVGVCTSRASLQVCVWLCVERWMGVVINRHDHDAPTYSIKSRQAPVGKDAEGWAYYSTSELLHAGSEGKQGGPQGKGVSEAFGPGDVIGVELDLHEGTLHFLKNDRCGWRVV